MDFSFEFLLNIALLLAQLYLGIIVILHNPKSFTHRFFLGLVLFMAVQGVVQSFVVSTNIGGNFDVQSRLSISLVPIQLLFLFLFLVNFPFDESKVKPKYLVIALLFILILTALGNTPLVFEKFLIEDGVAEPIPGPIFPVFTIALVLLIIINIAGIFVKYKKSPKDNKKQIVIVGAGIILTFIGLMISQYILPNFYGNADFLNLISLFTLPLLLATGYAIIGFRIFDVRLISAEIFTLFIWILFFFAFFFQPDQGGTGWAIIVSTLIIVMGILLTRNMTAEVKRRDQLEKLTEELRVTNIELRKAKVELEKLSRFKTQMLSFASHQIKAPLATIKGFASILMEGLYGEINDKVKITIGKMKNSADELIDLINTLLDMRKVEEGKMDYKFEPVMIKKLIADTVEQLQVQAKGKHLELTFETEIDPEVTADPQKLKQVIQNLTENAIKYTPEGFVRVKLEIQNGSVIFSVTDTGLGMSKELIPRLFGQEFVRDKNVRTQIKGTGLGLYIANQIIKDHGGTIWAESDGEGKGSRFYFKLPKAK